MSIGLGVFLGLALISLAIVFVATRERWPWKRIMLGVLVVLVGVPAAGLGALYLWNRMPKPNVPESELWGIRLGMPRKEVVFRKGPPQDSTSFVDSEGEVREVWGYSESYAPHYAIHFEKEGLPTFVWLKTAA